MAQSAYSVCVNNMDNGEHLIYSRCLLSSEIWNLVPAWQRVPIWSGLSQNLLSGISNGLPWTELLYILLFSHTVVSDSVAPWTTACQASLPFTVSLFKLMSIESLMPSNHVILCHPLLLASIFPSIRVFSNESALCIRWPKYWSFSINPSNEYSVLISFSIDWFDLLALQGNFKSLL